MKKIRIVMTMTAFALAVAGAVASSSFTPAASGVFGYTPEGYCINEGVSVPSGCSSSSGSTLCYAYFPQYGDYLPIYSVRASASECLLPYKRW